MNMAKQRHFCLRKRPQSFAQSSVVPSNTTTDFRRTKRGYNDISRSQGCRADWCCSALSCDSAARRGRWNQGVPADVLRCGVCCGKTTASGFPTGLWMTSTATVSWLKVTIRTSHFERSWSRPNRRSDRNYDVLATPMRRHCELCPTA